MSPRLVRLGCVGNWAIDISSDLGFLKPRRQRPVLSQWTQDSSFRNALRSSSMPNALPGATGIQTTNLTNRIFAIKHCSEDADRSGVRGERPDLGSLNTSSRRSRSEGASFHPRLPHFRGADRSRILVSKCTGRRCSAPYQKHVSRTQLPATMSAAQVGQLQFLNRLADE